MSMRKTWTQKQDEALRHLIEDEHLTKWVEIAHIMTDTLGYPCNQKQCRARYTHKLAKTVNSSPLTPQEETALFNMQEELGNRWAVIANKLSRTDNFVKNYFYAKLRRCMRKINKVLARFASNQYHKVQTASLYKIIETVQHNPLCKKIRDQLRKFEDEHYENRQLEERIRFAKEVADDIAQFDRKILKNPFIQEVERGEDELYDSESYHSSNPSSHNLTINSYTSSRSNSNSHSNSSHNPHSPHSPLSPPHPLANHKNLLLHPFLTKRSNSIEEDSDAEEQGEKLLFRSANLDNRAKLKPKEMEPESQDYLTSSLNMDMFDEVIKIRFISPKVSPQSSDKNSIDIEPQSKESPIRYDIKEENLWEMIAGQKQREYQ